MTIAEWLFDTMNRLGNAKVDSPRRDALVLLEDVLHKDRSWVLSHAEESLDETKISEVNKLIKRRLNREPLAYIRGKVWFYGRFFEVNPQVLIPRPESENIIEILKDLQPESIIDIGTGSGCLAITSALEITGVKITATDISLDAIKIAMINAKNHNVTIDFVESDLLKNLPSTTFQVPTTIVANLPYVPNNMDVEPELNTEPELALFAGEDGMDLYRRFWEHVGKLESTPDSIIVESLDTQHEQMEALAFSNGFKLVRTEILIQLFNQVN